MGGFIGHDLQSSPPTDFDVSTLEQTWHGAKRTTGGRRIAIPRLLPAPNAAVRLIPPLAPMPDMGPTASFLVGGNPG